MNKLSSKFINIQSFLFGTRKNACKMPTILSGLSVLNEARMQKKTYTCRWCCARRLWKSLHAAHSVEIAYPDVWLSGFPAKPDIRTDNNTHSVAEELIHRIRHMDKLMQDCSINRALTNRYVPNDVFSFQLIIYKTADWWDVYVISTFTAKYICIKYTDCISLKV